MQTYLAINLSLSSSFQKLQFEQGPDLADEIEAKYNFHLNQQELLVTSMQH